MTIKNLKRYFNKNMIHCMLLLVPISWPLVIQYSQWISNIQSYYNIPDTFGLSLLKSLIVNIGVITLMGLFVKKVIDNTYKYASCTDMSEEEFVEYKLELLKREFEEKYPNSSFKSFKQEE